MDLPVPFPEALSSNPTGSEVMSTEENTHHDTMNNMNVLNPIPPREYPPTGFFQPQSVVPNPNHHLQSVKNSKQYPLQMMNQCANESYQCQSQQMMFVPMQMQMQFGAMGAGGVGFQDMNMQRSYSQPYSGYPGNNFNPMMMPYNMPGYGNVFDMDGQDMSSMMGYSPQNMFMGGANCGFIQQQSQQQHSGSNQISMPRNSEQVSLMNQLPKQLCDSSNYGTSNIESLQTGNDVPDISPNPPQQFRVISLQQHPHSKGDTPSSQQDLTPNPQQFQQQRGSSPIPPPQQCQQQNNNVTENGSHQTQFYQYFSVNQPQQSQQGGGIQINHQQLFQQQCYQQPFLMNPAAAKFQTMGSNNMGMDMSANMGMGFQGMIGMGMQGMGMPGMQCMNVQGMGMPPGTMGMVFGQIPPNQLGGLHMTNQTQYVSAAQEDHNESTTQMMNNDKVSTQQAGVSVQPSSSTSESGGIKKKSPKKKASSDLPNGGFVKTTSHSEKWYEMYEKLKNYKKEHGDCNVPQNYTKDPKLAHWVKNQRTLGKKIINVSNVSASIKKRISELEIIGFQWYAVEAFSDATNWDVHYRELAKFKKKHRHFDVPKDYSTLPSLNGWVERQHYLGNRFRQNMPARTMNSRRLKMLNDLGLFDTDLQPLEKFSSNDNNEEISKDEGEEYGNLPLAESRRSPTITKRKPASQTRVSFRSSLKESSDTETEELASYNEPPAPEQKKLKREDGTCETIIVPMPNYNNTELDIKKEAPKKGNAVCNEKYDHNSKSDDDDDYGEEHHQIMREVIPEAA